MPFRSSHITTILDRWSAERSECFHLMHEKGPDVSTARLRGDRVEALFSTTPPQHSATRALESLGCFVHYKDDPTRSNPTWTGATGVHTAVNVCLVLDTPKCTSQSAGLKHSARSREITQSVHKGVTGPTINQRHLRSDTTAAEGNGI
ncbi:hypothetical protein TNCV_4552551 [Trichonephila clavipes]|nr:hypothetical protein TNCV_4552551 [Trichonephila clavipes]